MDEEQKLEELLKKSKIGIPKLPLESGKKTAAAASTEAISLSMPSSPRSPLLKQAGKINCLCSPTTHPGSFRCRYHRNNKQTSRGLTRNSFSVGAKLSELAR
ncbi:hypothetical protein Leryth_001725 [Lithospermum erythrorhizon]|nr:hypothetical protein Leryth_001725 [Lithospermum erythrorhizon]